MTTKQKRILLRYLDQLQITMNSVVFQAYQENTGFNQTLQKIHAELLKELKPKGKKR